PSFAANVDLFHIMSPFELHVPINRLFPAPIARQPSRYVVTLYDLIPLKYATVYLRDPVARRRYQTRLRLIQDADHVLAISQSTAQDAIELLGISPEKVTVVHGGVSDDFRRETDPRADALQNATRYVDSIRGQFILYTGGVDYRKNLLGTLRGYA